MAPERHSRKRILGDADLTFRTATGECVKSGKGLYVEECDDWRVNLRVRVVQALVQTTVVCWRVHDDGWSCSHAW